MVPSISPTEGRVKISIIMPTFNSQKFVGYALMSLVKSVDEIVVVDMSSTDNTLKIIETFNDTKIRVFNLQDLIHKKEYNLNSSIECGLELIRGNVVIRADDDWIWGPEIAKLKYYCEQSLQEKKSGLRGSAYNLITTQECFLPLRERFIAVFRQHNNPIVHFGSYQTDNSVICHKSEIKKSSNRKVVKLRRSMYAATPIRFGHWKFLKDTKEHFIYKYRLFTGCPEYEAMEWWEYFHKQPRTKCPSEILQPLYDYRDKFVPLGGFDVTA